ncbi:hypothetical protein [Allocoleopsis sp.]
MPSILRLRKTAIASPSTVTGTCDRETSNRGQFWNRLVLDPFEMRTTCQ